MKVNKEFSKAVTNTEIDAEEVAEGLWDKKKAVKKEKVVKEKKGIEKSNQEKLF